MDDNHHQLHKLSNYMHDSFYVFYNNYMHDSILIKYT